DRPEQCQAQAIAVKAHPEVAIVNEEQPGPAQRSAAFAEGAEKVTHAAGKDEDVERDEHLLRDQRRKEGHKRRQQKLGAEGWQWLSADLEEALVSRRGMAIIVQDQRAAEMGRPVLRREIAKGPDRSQMRKRQQPERDRFQT